MINHRSNMDYVLVAFLAAERVALSFAVGEWARIWPLDTCCAPLGAFFVRRDRATISIARSSSGMCSSRSTAASRKAFFSEGGLSRDGRLRPPRFGLLSYATRHFSRIAPRDLVFVPVAINYDRVLEDRTLLRDLEPGSAGRRGCARSATAGGWARRMPGSTSADAAPVRYACVNFGAPLSLRALPGEHGLDFSRCPTADRFAETERLADALMDEIARLVPVTPVSLVATALLSFERAAASRAALTETGHAPSSRN